MFHVVCVCACFFVVLVAGLSSLLRRFYCWYSVSTRQASRCFIKCEFRLGRQQKCRSCIRARNTGKHAIATQSCTVPYAKCFVSNEKSKVGWLPVSSATSSYAALLIVDKCISSSKREDKAQRKKKILQVAEEQLEDKKEYIKLLLENVSFPSTESVLYCGRKV